MKQATLLLMMTIVFYSCGKDKDSCRNRETMRIECQAQNIPNYGYPYAREMCDRSYSADRCY